MKNNSLDSRGFTLVELSIVIVIIGLIISGVTAGASLVRQSGLRAVLVELDSYKSSLNAFKMQYNGLPGDLSNAYSYWGASCAGSAGACNGNGDGVINLNSADATRKESFMSWKHMALARIIPGTYTGNSGLGNSESTPGLNTPSSKLKGGEWWIESTSAWYRTNLDSLLVSRSAFIIGGHRSGSYDDNSLFTPKEAYSLDLKIDDGVPYTGKFVGLIGADGTNCVTGSGAAATYSISQTGAQCWMWATFGNK